MANLRRADRFKVLQAQLRQGYSLFGYKKYKSGTAYIPTDDYLPSPLYPKTPTPYLKFAQIHQKSRYPLSLIRYLAVSPSSATHPWLYSPLEYAPISAGSWRISPGASA
jgi:hypothetical protein